MKKLITLLLIIVSFGCSNQKPVDPIPDYRSEGYYITNGDTTGWYVYNNGHLRQGLYKSGRWSTALERISVSIDTSNCTLSFDLEDDVRMMEGKITDVDLSYFNHGDTLVLDVNSPGHWRHKRPNEVIGEYVYLGTVSKVDSGSWTEYGKVKDSIVWYENEYRNPNIENVDSIVGMMDSMLPANAKQIGSWNRFRHLEYINKSKSK
ncbi:hypothetical protein KAR91_73270 [Candidatus Pacearchaeota archaeon]|nr:hypothetical protein [Candidatus Pacearchaeota archaeon]